MGLSQQARADFSEALDASRNMVAMSQDVTPRNIYAPRNRGSTDSYFPVAHSSSSSISSASGQYPYYSGMGSIDSSATDYSSTSESMDVPPSRTLPPPTGHVGSGGIPPAPHTMMGSFSS